MPTKETGKFSFKVPEGHSEAGTKIEKTFTYDSVTSDQEAVTVIGNKKWSLKDLVNDVLKANARANAYQQALQTYTVSELTPDEMRNKMIRDFIRAGFSEEKATTIVDDALTSKV